MSNWTEAAAVKAETAAARPWPVGDGVGLRTGVGEAGGGAALGVAVGAGRTSQRGPWLENRAPQAIKPSRIPNSRTRATRTAARPSCSPRGKAGPRARRPGWGADRPLLTRRPR